MPQNNDADVIVVGGGAAGMMAAIAAKTDSNRVLVLEKNDKIGKKLYITGKGRCNLTNACDTEEIFSQVVTNAKFLYSSVYGFTNHDVIKQFTEWGLPLKEERGKRVFPTSDKSSDVIRMLEKTARRFGVCVKTGQEVADITLDPSKSAVTGVLLRNSQNPVTAGKVILATGGLSYPSTGSTGDGYRMASACGHTIVEPRPGLTGMTAKESFVQDLQGLTLLNTGLTLWDEGPRRKKVLEGFGELLFTHFGVSGPFVLTASSRIGDRLDGHMLTLEMDIKPALDDKQLDKRLLREIEKSPKRTVGHMMEHLLPRSLIPVMLDETGVDEQKRALDLTREDRRKLVGGIKHFTVTVTGTRGFEEAIITRGGVSVNDVNPHTMESKIISGLYFAGELLDVDALTGGFNLQIAWSTGCLAGRSTR